MSRCCIFILSFILSGCVFLDLMPSYSSYFKEDTWIHGKTKHALPDSIHMECLNISLRLFKTENTTGLERVIDPNDEVKATEIYASCLRNKGYVFNASYKYCYKFESICEKYNKYRR